MNSPAVDLALKWIDYYCEGWLAFHKANDLKPIGHNDLRMDLDICGHFAKSYADKKVGFKE